MSLPLLKMMYLRPYATAAMRQPYTAGSARRQKKLQVHSIASSKHCRIAEMA